MSPFKKLGISDEILKAIEEHRFEKPSEIQEKTIPLILQGKDVIAQSATGSGKTLAFGAGILHNTTKGPGVKSLILTPTRELAEQILVSLKKFSKYKPMRMLAVYGGVSINPQIDALRTAEVVIATPGRMLDHLQRRTIDLANVEIVVLDEADRMAEMGFIDDVIRILSQCKQRKQTLLFSATITDEVNAVARQFMNHPIKVSAQNQVDPTKLKQVYYNVQENEKLKALVNLMKKETTGLAMVFCNTKRAVDFVTRVLRGNDIKAMAIHGGYTQAKRTRALQDFHENKIDALICTDVAARGLDIKGVSHVYNYDLPDEPKQYIHRIGRTARAGKEGLAVNILSKRDHSNFQAILRVNRVNIEMQELPELKEIVFSNMEPSHSYGDGPQRGGFRSGGSRGGNRFGRSSPSEGGYGRSRSYGSAERSSGGYGGQRSSYGSRERSSSSEGGSSEGGFGRSRSYGSAERSSSSEGSAPRSYGSRERSSSSSGGYGQSRSYGSAERSSSSEGSAPRSFGSRERSSSSSGGYGQSRSYGSSEGRSSRPSYGSSERSSSSEGASSSEGRSSRPSYGSSTGGSRFRKSSAPRYSRTD